MANFLHCSGIVVNAKHRLRNVFLVMALAISMLVGCGGPSSSPATSFPKKTISFIVPVSPDGGYDTVSRMFIPYIGKIIFLISQK